MFLADAALTEAKDKLIVGWGDSLTEGGVCGAVPADTYPALLRNLYAADDESAAVINCGLGGETSKHALSRLTATMQCAGIAYERGYCTDPAQPYIWSSCDGLLWDRSGWYTAYNGHRPDFILIWIGANDVIHRLQVSATLFNIRQMVAVSRVHSMTPLVATVTPDEKYGEDNCTVGTLGALNQGIRDIASGMDVPLSDNCLAIPTWGAKDCGDGLHPNRTGNEKIAWTWYSVLPDRSEFDLPIILDGSLHLLLHR